MSNSKKEWANMTVGEKAFQVFVNVAVIAIAIVATIFLYFVKTECGGFDFAGPYCLTHPTSFFDILGTILFWFCCFWLSGIWGYFIKVEDDDNEIWGTMTKIAWGCGVAGLLLIWLL